MWIQFDTAATLRLLFFCSSLLVYDSKASSCISSTTHMHHGTLMNVQRRLTRKRGNCWIKLLFLFSLCTKGLNHWCHMDYFNDVLITFLGLERGSSVSVKNILICVLKVNEGLTGLERCEGEQFNDRIKFFGLTTKSSRPGCTTCPGFGACQSLFHQFPTIGKYTLTYKQAHTHTHTHTNMYLWFFLTVPCHCTTPLQIIWASLSDGSDGCNALHGW